VEIIYIMKPLFQAIFSVLSLALLVTGIVLISFSLVIGTPDLLQSVTFFVLGLVMLISMSTAIALAKLINLFSYFLDTIREQAIQSEVQADPRVTVRGISSNELDDMPDDHPLKKMLSSLGVIQSRQGNRNIAEMTIDELKEELRAEEADEKQDFEKCALLRDEIQKREKGDN